MPGARDAEGYVYKRKDRARTSLICVGTVSHVLRFVFSLSLAAWPGLANCTVSDGNVAWPCYVCRRSGKQVKEKKARLAAEAAEAVAAAEAAEAAWGAAMAEIEHKYDM